MPSNGAEANWPVHITALWQNLADVKSLLTIHSIMTGVGVGRRPPAAEVLNKSGFVLVCACWESYMEDLAKAAFEYMLDNARQPDQIPSPVCVSASKHLREDLDQRRVWDLAGEGWREILQNHKDIVLEKYVGRMHSPRSQSIDEMFEKLIGYRSLSGTWKWRRESNTKAIETLESLVALRGEIAHRVTAGRYVRKAEVRSAADFIQCLAAISSNRIRWHLRGIAGKTPWTTVSYRNVS